MELTKEFGMSNNIIGIIYLGLSILMSSYVVITNNNNINKLYTVIVGYFLVFMGVVSISLTAVHFEREKDFSVTETSPYILGIEPFVLIFVIILTKMVYGNNIVKGNFTAGKITKPLKYKYLVGIPLLLLASVGIGFYAEQLREEEFYEYKNLM